MQNKANFRNDKMNITIDMKMIYEKRMGKSDEKTKPIQTQFKPKQTQLKPIQTQFKANQTQFHNIFELTSGFKTFHWGQNYQKSPRFENKSFLTKG